MLVPVVMSWNAAGVDAASAYSFGFTLPSPDEPVPWLISARMPAKAGAPADVPPITVRKSFASR